MVVTCDQRKVFNGNLSPTDGNGNGAEATASTVGYVRELSIANAAEEGTIAGNGGEILKLAAGKIYQLHERGCGARTGELDRIK